MKPVVYQLFVRHFANHAHGQVVWGSREENGCGTFAGVNDAALSAIAGMGVTHLWLTGVLRHATQSAHPGIPAQPACVVKGKAGSPYAVTDYFDVDPDLSENPENRLEEFRELIARCRRHGLVPVMDFIPNHVSRCYESSVAPQFSFGAGDDRSRFFSRDNSFYYLEPCQSDWHLRLPDGEFEPERGCARVTGNNAALWELSAYDWYETVKLNYGVDYRHGAPPEGSLPGALAPAQAVPRTWRLMDSIISWWQEMGVGGFRCDMAHMVPVAFWRWLIANARLRDGEVFFMAEGYDDYMKLVPGGVHAALLAAGFRGVYDGVAYEQMRALYEHGKWANDLDALHAASSPLFSGGVRYVENHDEPRMASPQYWNGVGEQVMPAVMLAQYASTQAPVLVYNGQECAERAEGPGGYGGDNGRTSIFDYTHLPRFQHWTNGGLFDGAQMTGEERALRDYTVRLLRLLQLPAISKGGFYGLNWSNQQTIGYGRRAGETVSGHDFYSFLRHDRKARSTVLCLCNFSPEHEVRTHVSIPKAAQEWCGKRQGPFVFRDLMNPASEPLEISAEELAENGLPVRVPAGAGLLLEWA